MVNPEGYVGEVTVAGIWRALTRWTGGCCCPRRQWRRRQPAASPRRHLVFPWRSACLRLQRDNGPPFGSTVSADALASPCGSSSSACAVTSSRPASLSRNVATSACNYRADVGGPGDARVLGRQPAGQKQLSTPKAPRTFQRLLASVGDGIAWVVGRARQQRRQLVAGDQRLGSSKRRRRLVDVARRRQREQLLGA
jgi:hypothetical protein